MRLAGQGLFVAELKRALAGRGLDVALLAHDLVAEIMAVRRCAATFLGAPLRARDRGRATGATAETVPCTQRRRVG